MPNIEITFGLEAQGHIPIIEAQLVKYDKFLSKEEKRHMQYSTYFWKDVGRLIGWDPFTAALNYFEYLEKENEKNSKL